MTHEDGSEKFIPYNLPRLSPDEMVARSREFYQEMATRRSARVFSPESVPLEAVRNCIDTACTAPSGAHKQPWTFVTRQNVQNRRCSKYS